ncbi:hypothetical protein [Pseudomonas asiatica]|uniref:hypothetical protein n=1 Tax=Pseudomonas asiatica TaxID=2219225 RepID=UPI0018D6E3D6|nr:hypothetical protein [Pseudomonas asiatica]MBH3378369.1 hypothetical protein [Pseudomonas asiatica]
MNFAIALAMPVTSPADMPAQRRADQLHAEMLKLVDTLCRSTLVPGTNTIH